MFILKLIACVPELCIISKALALELEAPSLTLQVTISGYFFMNLSTSSRARSLVISCLVPIGNSTVIEIRPLSDAGKNSVFTSAPPPITTSRKNANAIKMVFLLFLAHQFNILPYAPSNQSRNLWKGPRISCWNLPL